MANPWEQPDPGVVLPFKSVADRKLLTDIYSSAPPFLRCLEVARAAGARTVVVETRYLDPDFRSEYSAFYSKGFRPIADSAHRLHFFAKDLPADAIGDLPTNPKYLGYVVVRPSAGLTVGRSVLAPPRTLIDAVRTQVTDKVNFFGRTLTVTGVPFVEQDANFLVCAHAASWMCHYSAFLRRDAARQLMADFALSVDASLGQSRTFASEGLTMQQMLELMRTFEMPPVLYDVDQLPPTRPVLPWRPGNPVPKTDQDGNRLHGGFWDTRLFAICCRYLNSGLPVIVGTINHAFLLCGYKRDRSTNPERIVFIRHDDQKGPYLEVANPMDDPGYSPWDFLLVPLPDKVWLPAEAAEARGASIISSAIREWGNQLAAVRDLRALIDANRLTLHTYVIRSNEFKGNLVQRGFDPTLAREYGMARFSRFVWVVEVVDRQLRKGDQPCVLGEVVFDATSSERNPNVLALHLPKLAWVHRIEPPARFPISCSGAAYGTGGFGPA